MIPEGIQITLYGRKINKEGSYFWRIKDEKGMGDIIMNR